MARAWDVEGDGAPEIAAALAGYDELRLERDVEAVEIPTGFHLTLAAGTPVRVVQQLGDAFTVVVDEQYLARVAAADADALGLEPPAPAALPEGASLEEQVWAQLRTCYDPEIPVNVVDLGLIVACRLEPGADGRTRVHVDLTLTAPGCGFGDVLRDDVRRKVRALPGVGEVEVEIVLDPPWDVARMSEAARLQLGLL